MGIFGNLYFRLFIFQLFVVCSIIAGLFFLATNMLQNMEIRGMKTGFDFLGETSGFGILFSLIDYNEGDTYGRTYLVGLVNTIFVSFVGIVFATVLGFVVGVARLSNNWLIKKLTAVYIELFRNLPILLQIFFWNFLVKNMLPGDAWRVSENVYIGLKGLIVPSLTPNNLFYVFLFFFLVMCFCLFRLPKWSQNRLEKSGKALPVFSVFGVTIFCFFVALFFLFGKMFAFENPVAGSFGLQDGFVFVPEIFVLVIALGVYTSTFVAEAVRSGIMSVDKGQREAALSLGLKPSFVLNRIIVPQAMKVVVPPCINNYLNLTKNSSLAMAIGFPDLVSVFAGTTLNQVGQAIEIMLITMFTYLALSVIVSVFLNWYNSRIKLSAR